MGWTDSATLVLIRRFAGTDGWDSAGGVLIPTYGAVKMTENDWIGTIVHLLANLNE